MTSIVWFVVCTALLWLDLHLTDCGSSEKELIGSFLKAIGRLRYGVPTLKRMLSLSIWMPLRSRLLSKYVFLQGVSKRLKSMEYPMPLAHWITWCIEVFLSRAGLLPMGLGDSMVSPLRWVSAATLRIGAPSVLGSGIAFEESTSSSSLVRSGMKWLDRTSLATMQTEWHWLESGSRAAR